MGSDSVMRVMRVMRVSPPLLVLGLSLMVSRGQGCITLPPPPPATTTSAPSTEAPTTSSGKLNV